jgi:hypothetical protein
VIGGLRNVELQELAKKHGLNPADYDFSKAKRSEATQDSSGRHQTDRLRMVDDIASRMTDAERARISKAAEGWEKLSRAEIPDRAREIISGGPEGERKTGTGPGSMLRHGAQLLMKAGPETGEGVTLYHGTSAESASRIANEGLKLPRESGIMGKNSASNDRVNFTHKRKVAEKFARYGADMEGSPVAQDGAIVHVEVPKSAIDGIEIERMREYLKTGEWPEGVEHQGLYRIPSPGFGMVSSAQNIPSQLIKKVEVLDTKASSKLKKPKP